MRSRIAALCLGAPVALLLATVPVAAGTVTVPLPGLVGEYVLTPTEGCPEAEPFISPDAFREMSFGLPFGAPDVGAAHVVLVGWGTNGLVRGDGLLAEDVEATALGAFAFRLILGGQRYDLYSVDTPPLEGIFTLALPMTKLVDRAPPEPGVDAVVRSVLMIGAYDPARPPDIPSGSGSAGGGGLIIVTPPRATVTEAYLVLEGPTIPEPATLALVAAGGFLLLRRRGTPRRRS